MLVSMTRSGLRVVFEPLSELPIQKGDRVKMWLIKVATTGFTFRLATQEYPAIGSYLGIDWVTCSTHNDKGLVHRSLKRKSKHDVAIPIRCGQTTARCTFEEVGLYTIEVEEAAMPRNSILDKPMNGSTPPKVAPVQSLAEMLSGWDDDPIPPPTPQGARYIKETGRIGLDPDELKKMVAGINTIVGYFPDVRLRIAEDGKLRLAFDI